MRRGSARFANTGHPLIEPDAVAPRGMLPGYEAKIGCQMMAQRCELARSSDRRADRCRSVRKSGSARTLRRPVHRRCRNRQTGNSSDNAHNCIVGITICLLEQTLAANLPLRSIASLVQRDSMASILRPICATCLHASPTMRLTASTNSPRGPSPTSSSAQSEDHALQSRRRWVSGRQTRLDELKLTRQNGYLSF